MERPHKKIISLARPGLLFLLVAMSLCSACSGTKLLMTKTVNFRSDSNYNDGLILPVDLVYIPDGEKPDAVTGVSPDEWFDSQARQDWPYIQSLSFRETDVRETTKITLRKAKKTTMMVIIADYRGLNDTKSQMIILDADSKENEDVFITINGLLH